MDADVLCECVCVWCSATVRGGEAGRHVAGLGQPGAAGAAAARGAGRGGRAA